MTEAWSTIPIKPKTRDKLKTRGQIGDTYDDVINRLLKETKDKNEVRDVDDSQNKTPSSRDETQ